MCAEHVIYYLSNEHFCRNLVQLLPHEVNGEDGGGVTAVIPKRVRCGAESAADVRHKESTEVCGQAAAERQGLVAGHSLFCGELSMNPQQAAAYSEWQRKRHLTPTQPPPPQPPSIPGDPYILNGGPMAGATVFLANPSTLPVRWRGVTGRYVGERGSTSLEWTVITARRGWFGGMMNIGQPV